MTSRLQFDAETHTYRLGDVVLPSVSDIIRPLTNLGGIPKGTLEFARDRGTAVHRACELLDLEELGLDELDRSTLDDRILPYLSGYEKFRKDYKVEWTAIEEPEYSPLMLFAGTPDRRGVWRDKTEIIIDIKATAKLSPIVQVQLSGYDLMSIKKVEELWSVRLLNDGGYVRTVHPAAHSTFISCLNIFRWRQKNSA